MKKIISVILVVLAITAIFVTPVYALQAGAEEVSNPVQLYLIGVIASVIVYIIKLISQKFPKFVFKREWLTIFLYVIAVVLSFFWQGVVLPVFGAFSDPVSFANSALTWISDVLVAIGPALAFATLIYNLLLKRVLERVAVRAGWSEAG